MNSNNSTASNWTFEDEVNDGVAMLVELGSNPHVTDAEKAQVGRLIDQLCKVYDRATQRQQRKGE